MTLEIVRHSISTCQGCALARTRRHAVPGEGPASTEIALLGEAPGWNEDQQGRPFCGAAGEMLDSELERIGLPRAEVYILNVINCKPNRNRDPLPSELEACQHFIWEQLEQLPKLRVIVALGRYASLALCPKVKPADLRGKARYLNGVVHLFLFHPAAALHNPAVRPELSRGFDLLRTLR